MLLTPPTRTHYAASLLIALFVLWGVLLYRGLGEWLVIEDELPERVDVIFTFGGETVREQYSRELMDTHPGAIWVNSTFDAEVRSRQLDPSIDTSRLVLVDSLEDTWGEVRFIRGWLLDRLAATDPPSDTAQPEPGEPTPGGPTSDLAPPNSLNVALVSGPYHMRRIRTAAVRMISDDRIDLYYTPAPRSRYPFAHDAYRYWWRDKTLSNIVKSECVKTVYYLFRI